MSAEFLNMAHGAPIFPTSLNPQHPAHVRIAKANAREGGRHRDPRAWLGEGTRAGHALTTASVKDRRRCPACYPTTYATHFARHRADG